MNKKLLRYARYYNYRPKDIKYIKVKKNPFKGADYTDLPKLKKDLMDYGYKENEAREIVDFAINYTDYHGGFKYGKKGLGGEQIDAGSIKRNSEHGKEVKRKARKRFVRNNKGKIAAGVGTTGAAGIIGYNLTDDKGEN